jgi:hypothetical protein
VNAPNVPSAPAGGTPERERLLEAEVVRLNAELETLERRWKQKHRLGWFALVAIPVFFLAPSPGWAFGVVFATPFLVLTQAYLIGMRRAECRQLILQTERDLEKLRMMRG